jgi:hypothetical protein
MKLGKAPPRHDPRTLQFEKYIDPDLHITVPTSFGHERDVYKIPYEDWGMLGNDNYGDCVFAGAAHETQIWNAERRVPVNFTDEAVLSDYAAVTGFNPVTGAGDNGTVVLDALNYRRKVGIVDAQGKRHKIAAYAAVEPGNWHNVLTALYLFHNIGIGINFPNTAMDQFNHGKPWTKIMNYRLDGGHYIPIVAKRGSYLDVVTWSRIQRMTKTFFQFFCDEAYVLFSEEMLMADRSSEGFDSNALLHDLQVVTHH